MSGIVNPGAGYCQVTVGPDSRRCLKSHPCPEHDPLPGPEWRKRNAMSSPVVPRRAVFDDLREGQWVAWIERGLVDSGYLFGGLVEEVDAKHGYARIVSDAHTYGYSRDDETNGPQESLTILRDPPAPPVTVPRELIDNLAEAARITSGEGRLLDAARAVVDHASEGNPT